MHAASVCPEPGSNSPTKQRTVLTERSLQASSSIQKIDESALCVPATLQLLKIVPLCLPCGTGHGRDVSGNRTNSRVGASTLFRRTTHRGGLRARGPPSTTQGLGSHCARKPPPRVALSEPSTSFQ